MTDKFLIVDDEPNNLDVLRNCLTEAGFKVAVLESGETNKEKGKRKKEKGAKLNLIFNLGFLYKLLCLKNNSTLAPFLCSVDIAACFR